MRRVLLCTLIVALMLAFTSQAWALGLDDPISAFFKRAQETIDRAMAQARETGNALLASAGTELDVAMQNAAILVGRERKEALRELEIGPLREVLMRMDELCNRLDAWQRVPFELEEVASLDAAEMLAGLKVAGIPLSDHRFIMKRVEGLTQLRGDQPYRLVLIGTDLGLNPSDIHTKVQLFTGRDFKDEIQTEQFRYVQHQLTLRIPTAVLNAAVLPDHPTVVPVRLRVEFQYKRGVLPGWDTTVCSYDLAITVLPETAGEATLEIIRPVMKWEKIGETRAVFEARDNQGVSEPSLPPLPIGQRYQGAQLDCNDHGNGGNAFLEKDDLPIYWEGDRRCKFHVVVRGPGVTETITAEIVELHEVGTKTEARRFALRWGQLVTPSPVIPGDWKEAIVSGKLVTDQEFSFPLTGTDPTGSLRVEKIVRGEREHTLLIRARTIDAPLGRSGGGAAGGSFGGRLRLAPREAP